MHRVSANIIDWVLSSKEEAIETNILWSLCILEKRMLDETTMVLNAGEIFLLRTCEDELGPEKNIFSLAGN